VVRAPVSVDVSLHMTLYRVLIQGSGFDIEGEEGSRMRGFAVVRLVEAQTEAEAIASATARVAEDWSVGDFRKFGIWPILHAAEIEQLGYIERLRAAETGYVFCTDAG
jgi:hypothetical protein